MKTSRPSDARRFAVEAVPSSAYWRDPLDAELKVDFAALEVSEGRLLEGASLRFALIVSGHMAWVLDWIRRPGFGPAALRNPPAELMADEFGAELTRIFVRSYWEGTETYARWLGRQATIEGRTPGAVTPAIGLTPQAINKMRQNAYQLAIGITRGIWSRLAPVIESAFAPNGQRLKTTEQIDGEIRSIYGSDYLQPVKKGFTEQDILELSGGFRGDISTLWLLDDELIRKPIEPQPAPRGRPMQIRDRTAYDRWQRSNLPYSKWIKQAAETIIEESRDVPELTLNMLQRWVQTERTRYFNHGTVQSALLDPNVKNFQFSALREANTCAVCRGRDGMVRPKNDWWWAFNQPPVHHKCRCNIVPITVRERSLVTPQSALPSQADVPVGFGTYDREAAQATRRIVVPMPSGRAQATAGRVSGYKPAPPYRKTVPSNYPGFLLPSEWSGR